MKSRCRFPRRAEADVILPELLSIEGRRLDAAKPLRIIVGFAAGGAAEITAS